MLHSIEPFVRAEAMNPYVPLLVESIPPESVSRMFCWRFALFDRYELVHLTGPTSAPATGRASRPSARISPD